MQKAVSSILLLTSLLFSVATPVLADASDNISLDCGFFGLEGTGFNTAQNFSLAAFEGGAIANAMAIPLELNPRFNYLTAIEFVEINPTVFSLADGTLYSNGTATLLHVAKNVQNGTEVAFSPTFTLTSISQFCAIASTDPEIGSPNPTLAAFGNTDAFSICKTTTIPPTSAIVYNPTTHSKGYEFKTCVEVQLLVTLEFLASYIFDLGILMQSLPSLKTLKFGQFKGDIEERDPGFIFQFFSHILVEGANTITHVSLLFNSLPKKLNDFAPLLPGLRNLRILIIESAFLKPEIIEYLGPSEPDQPWEMWPCPYLRTLPMIDQTLIETDHLLTLVKSRCVKDDVLKGIEETLKKALDQSRQNKGSDIDGESEFYPEQWPEWDAKKGIHQPL